MAQMTKEDRDLLLKDLCARLPYKVKVKSSRRTTVTALTTDIINDFCLGCDVKPYLRQLSSMTEEEREELSDYLCERVMPDKIGITFPPDPIEGKGITFRWMQDCLDWLNSHHFDYRGLIGKGLAEEWEEKRPQA